MPLDADALTKDSTDNLRMENSTQQGEDILGTDLKTKVSFFTLSLSKIVVQTHIQLIDFSVLLNHNLMWQIVNKFL